MRAITGVFMRGQCLPRQCPSIGLRKAQATTIEPADFATNPENCFVEGGNYFSLLSQRYLVLGSSVKSLHRMFWIQGAFRGCGKPVMLRRPSTLGKGWWRCPVSWSAISVTIPWGGDGFERCCRPAALRLGDRCGLQWSGATRCSD
ncbi:MAG: hypothetical protein M2R45_02169 [Verrucomicrobia subdivision 3 bacterium]|nr:hypothetical protein [Limisphaerales bacterium]MCS1413745.1 hypothetical protein [Limisphaerales bacterium]